MGICGSEHDRSKRSNKYSNTLPDTYKDDSMKKTDSKISNQSNKTAPTTSNDNYNKKIIPK